MKGLTVGTIGLITAPKGMKQKSDLVKNIPATVKEIHRENSSLTIELLNPDTFSPLDDHMEVKVSANRFTKRMYNTLL